MRHLLYVCFLWWLTSLGLSVMAQSVPWAEADSLRRALSYSRLDTSRVKILLQLGKYQVSKPGELQADMDSALSFIRQAEVLSRKLKYLKGKGNSNLLFAQVYREMGKQDIGKLLINKAILLFSKYHYFQELGEAYMELKHYYSVYSTKEELQQRIKIVTQALAAFQQSGNKLKQATVLQELADLSSIAGNLPQALLELKQSLTMYQEVNYLYLQGVYDLLGAVSSQLGDYKEGIRYGLLAVQTAEQVGDSSTQICTIYNRLGITYYYLKNFEQAAAYYQKGLLHAIKLSDHNAIFILAHNLSNSFLKLNKPFEALALVKDIVKKYPPTETLNRIFMTANFITIYLRLKQYTQAERYFNELLQIDEKYELAELDYMTFSNTAVNYLLETQQYNKARKYLMDHEARVNKLSVLKEASQVEKFWFKLDSAQANYLSAINHYQRYKTLEDSLFNETKSKQVANLEVLYETEKKEKNLQLKEQNIKALTKEKQLQAEKINKDRLIRNGIIGGALLLLLLLGVIYNRYRLKQRSNRQLQEQQRQLQAQQSRLLAQHEELQTQQEIIHQKNTELVQLVDEKDTLLTQQERLLEEKERLLKEIHHRVKNNLQIVMSLLNSQAASLQDKAALSAIQESQNRVQAMALIHQKLYQAEGVARIPMKAYIEEVVAYLSESYSTSQPVSFNLAVDKIELDVAQAVPLGLIINEAITNAFKYAFPDGRRGNVSLCLHRLAEHIYELSIADDGVGLPQDFDPSRSRSLGMTLLYGFSAQLEGDLVVKNSPGVTINLVFTEVQISSKYSSQTQQTRETDLIEHTLSS